MSLQELGFELEDDTFIIKPQQPLDHKNILKRKVILFFFFFKFNIVYEKKNL